MAFDDFNKLAQSIVLQQCAVVVGAGVSYPLLPSANELASEMEAGLPSNHPARSDGLASVAQALSTLNHPLMVKFDLQAVLASRLRSLTPDSEEWLTQCLIAALPIKVFITTNYDHILVDALKSEGKNPQVMISPWKSFESEVKIPISVPARVTIQKPLVLHLHGHLKFPETMVLTEDDYIQFLFSMAIDIATSPHLREWPLVPLIARKALSSQNILILGYRAADINFRLLVKSAEALRRNEIKDNSKVRVSVLLPSSEERQVMEYVESMYEQSLSFKLFWGSAYKFLTALRPFVAGAHQRLAKRSNVSVSL